MFRLLVRHSNHPFCGKRWSTTLINGLREVIDRYDIFLLDQFGVLHDGRKPLPGCLPALEALHQAGKTTVILSNTSSLSKSARKRYAEIGLPGYYQGFVTSGDLMSHYLKQHYHGKRCTWFTWAHDSHPKNMGFELANIENADFVLLNAAQVIASGNSNKDDDNGVEEIEYMMTGKICDKIDRILSIALKRDLPVICGNADLTARSGSRLFYMPGGIMEEYKKRGGKVIAFGKPFSDAFVTAIDIASKHRVQLQQQTDASVDIDINHWLVNKRIVHVGDSLHHDIAGK